MTRMVWRQVLARRQRSLALLIGVMVSVTGFTVLTSATGTSRLAVTSTVAANARSAYDILVRPVGSRTSLEAGRGLVQPNQQSGQYGGISNAQWQRIRTLPGIQVAAPIASIGSVSVTAHASVDVTGTLDPTLTDQVVRLRQTWVADNGLTRATEPTPRFVYVTRHRVAVPIATDNGLLDPDGHLLPARTLLTEDCDWRSIPQVYLEQVDGHGWQPICGTQLLTVPGGSGDAVANLSQLFVLEQLPDGTFLDFTNVGDSPDESRGITGTPRATSRPTFDVSWPVWIGVAAIDPGQEDRLVGLEGALTSGVYFPEVTTNGAGPQKVPALVASSTEVSEHLDVTAERLSDTAVDGIGPQPLLAQLTASSAIARQRTSYAAATVYPSALADLKASVRLDISIAPSSPTYSIGSTVEGRNVLTPQRVPVDPGVWSTSATSFGGKATGALALEPYLANDLGFRALGRTSIKPLADVVLRPTVDEFGVFDPARLVGFSALSAVPLETYRSSAVTGADARSRVQLQGQPLQPNDDPAGYLTAPPALLIPLDTAELLTGRADLISAIRVRVAGVTGIDAVSRERVRLVAERISQSTELDVDVTVGSSPQAQLVALPAGRFGRPALNLDEPWTKEGVAVSIITAVDRKSLLLFGLVLVACLLFVANATAAAVRERRRELAILSCLGWPAWRRTALVVTETGVVGTLAGVLAAAVAVPLGRVMSISVAARHAWLAVPVAVAVSVLASLAPAVRAGRAHPAAAMQPAVARAGRTREVRGLPGLARTNLLRTPGRTAVAVISLTVAVTALTMLAALLWAFDGTVVGTLLGDAVSVRARQVDVLAVVATVAIAQFAVVDVLYLNIRDRAAELAFLRAAGWSEGLLARLVLWEALGVAVLGTAAGCALGVLGMASFAGGITPALLGVTALIGAAGVALTLAAGTIPALAVDRRPTAALLAES